jgi:hypothetical protein
MADEMVTFDEILADPVYKAEFDRRVTKALSTVQAKLDKSVAERGEMKSQEDYAELKKQLDELQTKYNTETEQFKTQLSDRDYADALTRAIAGANIKFSSKAAEKAFIADLKANRLEMKDGNLEGFSEYHKAQLEADPTAFQSDKPAPTFAKVIGAGGEPATESKGAMYAKQFNSQYATTTKE